MMLRAKQPISVHMLKRVLPSEMAMKSESICSMVSVTEKATIER